MKFRVHGLHMETGDELDIVVDAPNPMAAAEKAQAMRIAVSTMDVEGAPSATEIRVVQAPPIETGHASTLRTGRVGVGGTADVVIEQTSKKWKLVMLWGAIICLGGGFGGCAFSAVLHMGAKPGPQGNEMRYVAGMISLAAMACFLGGFVTWIVGRVAAWWHHG